MSKPTPRIHFLSGDPPIRITAVWNERKKAYIAMSGSIAGLITDAPTIEALQQKLPPIIARRRKIQKKSAGKSRRPGGVRLVRPGGELDELGLSINHPAV
jgi:Domain of unknown function (DUF1902)